MAAVVWLVLDLIERRRCRRAGARGSCRRPRPRRWPIVRRLSRRRVASAAVLWRYERVLASPSSRGTISTCSISRCTRSTRRDSRSNSRWSCCTRQWSGVPRSSSGSRRCCGERRGWPSGGCSHLDHGWRARCWPRWSSGSRRLPFRQGRSRLRWSRPAPARSRSRAAAARIRRVSQTARLGGCSSWRCWRRRLRCIRRCSRSRRRRRSASSPPTSARRP